MSHQGLFFLFAKAKFLTIYGQRGKNPQFYRKWSGTGIINQ
ncbi:hypothetical protein D922_02727 [Enterococcus faecalis 06-MB-DW-09]|nr:hypothetical protein D922_02727 [Enterococcus faecalis 06-MB-DW-09]